MIHNREERQFQLVSEFKPQGDQPQAIEKLVQGIQKGKKNQVLLGVTGSGKTFTMANVIARINKPTLVMAPNKTLAAQLYGVQARDAFTATSAVVLLVLVSAAAGLIPARRASRIDPMLAVRPE